MKLDYPKEWFEQRIEREESLDIEAGLPGLLYDDPVAPSLKVSESPAEFRNPDQDRGPATPH